MLLYKSEVAAECLLAKIGWSYSLINTSKSFSVSYLINPHLVAIPIFGERGAWSH